MFDQIKQLVEEHLGNNPEVSSNIPDDKKNDVYSEVAGHVTNGIQNHASAQGGGILSMLEGAISSNSPLVNAIEGGLVGSLAGKFGLPAAATGAIAASLPGLLQKFVHKANDPNDQSITPESINKSLPGQ
jgi:hypothetical protein